MATPTGITLAADAVIVEISDDQIGNSVVAGSALGGGYVRQEGTAWTGDAVVDDYIQFIIGSPVQFQQDGVTFCYVAKADYLFIQAPL